MGLVVSVSPLHLLSNSSVGLLDVDLGLGRVGLLLCWVPPTWETRLSNDNDLKDEEKLMGGRTAMMKMASFPAFISRIV